MKHTRSHFSTSWSRTSPSHPELLRILQLPFQLQMLGTHLTHAPMIPPAACLHATLNPLPPAKASASSTGKSLTECWRKKKAKEGGSMCVTETASHATQRRAAAEDLALSLTLATESRQHTTALT